MATWLTSYSYSLGLSILVQAMNEAAEQVLKNYSFKHPVAVETIQLLLTNIIDEASEKHR